MTYVSTCVADGAVGLYALGDASVADSATAADEAAIANGAYASSGWTGGQTGIPGMLSKNAARVTAGGGWVIVPDVAGNRTANTFTYELWIKLAALPGSNGGLIGINGGTTMFRMLTDGSFKLTQQGVADIAFSTAGVAANNTWHHITCAKNGGSGTRMVLNGVDVSFAGTDEVMASSSGSGYLLAKTSNDNTPAATFAMMAIYPTALSLATSQNHYALGNPTTAPGGGFFGLF